jgi:hypothetical protein
MEDSNNTGTLDQIDEDILSYTVSDEALEAAAGTERGQMWTSPPYAVPGLVLT